MKIGIFGDSYADWQYIDGHDQTNTPWATHVKNLGYDVTNFAQCGSGLMYSYEKFLKHQKKFDKVIFVITGPGRILLPEDTASLIAKSEGMREEWAKHWTGGQGLGLKQNLDAEWKSAIYLYYLYIMNDNTDHMHHELITQDISSNYRTENMLLLPAFFTGRVPLHGFNKSEYSNIMDMNPTGSVIGSRYFTLYGISQLDEYHNTIQAHKSGVHDSRTNHMSASNNIIFANKIIEWIETGIFKADIKDFVNS